MTTQTTLKQLTSAFVNLQRDRPLDAAALTRLNFWQEALGALKPVIEITADDVDVALAKLQQRGKLVAKPGSNTRDKNAREFVRVGELAGSTVNRYLSTLGELMKQAKRMRVVPRAHVSPLAGIERAPEPVDPARYLRREEVEKIIAVALVLDRHWRRLACLIRVAFVTGLRVGALEALAWTQVDLKERVLRIGKTKNGDPIIATLTRECVEALETLDRSADPTELVFRSRAKPHRAHDFRRLWNRCCIEAGLPGRNFHQVRHGTGSYLAMKNVNQAGIMAVMGHRTLAASRRYIHHNTADKHAITQRVFGEE